METKTRLQMARGQLAGLEAWIQEWPENLAVAIAKNPMVMHYAGPLETPEKWAWRFADARRRIPILREFIASHGG